MHGPAAREAAACAEGRGSRASPEQMEKVSLSRLMKYSVFLLCFEIAPVLKQGSTEV